MMRLFANTFLLLFVADGGISFLDQLASLFFPLPTLAALQNLAANLVLLMAIAVYLCLGIDQRLPKRVFLPLIGYLFLCLFLLLMFPDLSQSRLFGLLSGAGQLFLCLIPMKTFRSGGRPTLTMPKEMFVATPSFNPRKSAIFVAVNLVFLPCFLAVLVVLTANAYLVRYTSGFMRLAPDGVHMSEKTYRRGNKTVRLDGMIHVAEKDYYEKVVGGAAPGRTIVLAEGVSDEKNLLHNRPDYGKLAGYLGLSTQQERMHFAGRTIDEEEFAAGPRGKPAGNGEVDILRADVDISTFQPITVWFLDTLGKQMKESPTLSKQLLSSVAWSEKNVTPAMQKVVMDDILTRRNEVLISHLKKALERYDTVVVPWGALHMADIESEVLKEGFQLQQVQDRVSIRFSKR